MGNTSFFTNDGSMTGVLIYSNLNPSGRVVVTGQLNNDSTILLDDSTSLAAVHDIVSTITGVASGNFVTGGYTGNFTVGGNATVTGNITSSGTISTTGAIISAGDVKFNTTGSISGLQGQIDALSGSTFTVLTTGSVLPSPAANYQGSIFTVVASGTIPTKTYIGKKDPGGNFFWDEINKVIDVKQFGAVGDGVTDDTVAIQAALDHARLIGGAVVLIENGTYLVSNYLTIGSNINFKGQNASIKFISGSSAGLGYLIRNYDIVSGNTNILIDGITFDANYTGSPSGVYNIMWLYSCNKSMITNCKFLDAHSQSIALVGQVSAECYDCTISNNIVLGRTPTSVPFGDSNIVAFSPINGTHNLYTPAPERIRNIIITNNFVSGSRWGINLRNAKNCIISNNIITDNTDRNIICFATCSDILIEGNDCSYSAGAGILMNCAGSRNRIVNNKISNIQTVRTYGGQGVGIFLEYDMDDTVISNNIIDTTSQAAIAIRYGCQRTIISDNIIKNSSAQGIDIRSGYLSISGNPEISGYVTRTHIDTIINGNLITNTALGAIAASRESTTGKIYNLAIYNNQTPSGSIDVSSSDVTFATLNALSTLTASAGYGTINSGGANIFVLGGGGTSPNAGSICFGDNTGWQFKIGTNVGGTFYPQFYFKDTGSLGLGTAPVGDSYLEINAGGTTYSPIKLTPGTLMTTPNPGSIEFDGTNLTYTTNTPTRRIVQSQNTSGTLPSATAADRGIIYHLQQGTGIADEVYICIKKADDTYDWIQIA